MSELTMPNYDYSNDAVHRICDALKISRSYYSKRVSVNMFIVRLLASAGTNSKRKS